MINFLTFPFQKSTWNNYFSSRKMFKNVKPLLHILITLDILMFNTFMFGVLIFINGNLISYVCALIIWCSSSYLYLLTISDFPRTIHWIKNYLDFTLREVHEEKM